MESKSAEDLRYPIGQFDKNFDRTARSRGEFIDIIAELPKNVVRATAGLTDDQLDTPYRPGGWTVRQTVHHIADSHLNAYTRFKLALTEDVPTIRPYFEDRWAELADSKMPIDISLKLIDAVHTRWVAVLESMTDDDFARRLIHPESGEWSLDGMLAMYAWHSRHHTAHITTLRKLKAW
jgi:uncharacterized damage-inducible protein DinB